MIISCGCDECRNTVSHSCREHKWLLWSKGRSICWLFRERERDLSQRLTRWDKKIQMPWPPLMSQPLVWFVPATYLCGPDWEVCPPLFSPTWYQLARTPGILITAKFLHTHTSRQTMYSTFGQHLSGLGAHSAFCQHLTPPMKFNSIAKL